jgi:hypothetical protein
VAVWPGVVTAGLLLVFVQLIWHTETFGVVVTVGAAVVGAWAAYVAYAAAQDGREMAQVVSRLLILEQLAQLRVVHASLLPLIRVRFRASSRPDFPLLRLSKNERVELRGPLWNALESSNAVLLPACRTLARELADLNLEKGRPWPPRDDVDYDNLILAAEHELSEQELSLRALLKATEPASARQTEATQGTKR